MLGENDAPMFCQSWGRGICLEVALTIVSTLIIAGILIDFKTEYYPLAYFLQ